MQPTSATPFLQAETLAPRFALVSLRAPRRVLLIQIYRRTSTVSSRFCVPRSLQNLRDVRAKPTAPRASPAGTPSSPPWALLRTQPHPDKPRVTDAGQGSWSVAMAPTR